jgi:hypothetical protein
MLLSPTAGDVLDIHEEAYKKDLCSMKAAPIAQAPTTEALHPHQPIHCLQETSPSPIDR